MKPHTHLAYVLAAALLIAGCSDDSGTTSASSNTQASSTGAGGGSGGSGATGGAGGNAEGGAGGSGAGATMVFGDPIIAPPDQWSWVDFEDAFCANGSATGIAVNPSAAGSDLVLIYMMGGGACWDEQSCYVNSLAVNMTNGFGEADLAGLAGTLNAGPFDRSDASNPFQQASYVFVPYCTGDLHAGNATTAHGSTPTMHVGYANMGAYLSRLVPTFAGAQKVVLAGGSAGGYGATFNFARAHDWFDAAPAGSVRVDLLNDSGPLLPQMFFDEGLEQAMRGAWGLNANLPAGCAQCGEALDALYGHLAGAYPNSRAAFLTYTNDNVIEFYFGLTAGDFAMGLQQLGVDYFIPNDHWHDYAVNATGHVLMTAAWSGVSSGGVGLKSWVGQMVSDDPGWASVP